MVVNYFGLPFIRAAYIRRTLDGELCKLIYLDTKGTSWPIFSMAEIQNAAPEEGASSIAPLVSVSSIPARVASDVLGAGARSRSVWLVCLPVFAIVILLAGACNSSTSSGPLSPEELEKKAQGIDKSLMCPICPAETIDQSSVALANQMQAIVREKLAQGESREEILQYFVDAYGPNVLAEPPKRGFNLLVWVIPPVGLLLGGGIVVMVVRGMRRPSDEYAAEEEPLDEAELEPYLSQVDQDIRRLTTGGPPEGSGPPVESQESPGEGTSERRVE